ALVLEQDQVLTKNANEAGRALIGQLGGRRDGMPVAAKQLATWRTAPDADQAVGFLNSQHGYLLNQTAFWLYKHCARQLYGQAHRHLAPTGLASRVVSPDLQVDQPPPILQILAHEPPPVAQDV